MADLPRPWLRAGAPRQRLRAYGVGVPPRRTGRHRPCGLGHSVCCQGRRDRQIAYDPNECSQRCAGNIRQPRILLVTDVSEIPVRRAWWRLPTTSRRPTGQDRAAALTVLTGLVGVTARGSGRAGRGGHTRRGCNHCRGPDGRGRRAWWPVRISGCVPPSPRPS